MQVHSNATTTKNARIFMMGSTLTCRALAERFSVSASTALKWRSRDSSEDRSSRPKTLKSAMDEGSRAAAVALRKELLTLDLCMDALEPLWSFSRATLARFLASVGLGNLRPAKAKAGSFKDYDPGFLHIDCTYLPKIKGSARFVFVAIDRATRLAFVRVCDKRDMETAVSFFRDALEFFPFKIHRVLTDNGAEFTNRFFRRWPNAKVKEHGFVQLLSQHGISHRLTKPYTPKTNGLVERFNRILKDATLGKRNYQCHTRLQRDIEAWIDIYNTRRKHSSLGRITPSQQASQWYNRKPEIYSREPTLLSLSLFTTS